MVELENSSSLEALVSGTGDAHGMPLPETQSQTSSIFAGREQQDFPRWKVAALTCFCYPVAGVNSVMGLAIIPREAASLAPQHETFFFWLLWAMVVVAQIVGPLVGVLSDQLRHHYGRRRPVIATGTFLGVVGAFWMWRSSVNVWASSFAFGLLLLEVGLVLINVALMSLVSEVCYWRQLGEASGMISTAQCGGNLSGVMYALLAGQHAVTYFYPLVIVKLTFACSVVWYLAPDHSSVDRPPAASLTWHAVKRAYHIDPVGEVNYFWAFAACAFFYIAMSIQMFSCFYLHDLLDAGAKDVLPEQLGYLTLCALGVATLLSYPIGKFSDVVGRLPLIYSACLSTAAVYLGYALVLLVDSVNARLLIARVLAILYGMAISCYLSVSFVIALECAPWGRGRGEALGLWCAAGFLGSFAGSITGTALLAWRGGGSAGALTGGLSGLADVVKSSGYSYDGYIAILSVGACTALSSALLTTPLVGVK